MLRHYTLIQKTENNNADLLRGVSPLRLRSFAHGSELYVIQGRIVVCRNCGLVPPCDDSSHVIWWCCLAVIAAGVVLCAPEF
jgi:hypothetical protein